MGLVAPPLHVDLPGPGVNPVSCALAGGSLPLSNQAHNNLKDIENSKEFLTMWAVSMDIYHIKNGH